MRDEEVKLKPLVGILEYSKAYGLLRATRTINIFKSEGDMATRLEF